MHPQSREQHAIGRGAGINPANRFERVHVEDDLEQLAADDETLTKRRLPTVFLPEQSRRVISENNSPDLPFRYSINPYRGCEHGCL